MSLIRLCFKWIKRITADSLEFEDGEAPDTKNQDRKRIKPLIRVKNMDNNIPLAKTIITEELVKAGCGLKRLLHFGSRARGDFRQDSDWDFYAIIERDIPFAEKRHVATRIRRRFVQAGFWGDIFIQSEDVVRERKGNTGHLTYYVLKEGIDI